MKTEIFPRHGIGSFLTVAVVAFLATTVSVRWLPADEAGKDPAATFYEPYRVPLVSVEVMVTDKQGVPIRGLTREEFQVFEDDRPVAITHFFASDPELQKIDPEGYQEALPENFSQDLYLALYFDDTNIDNQRRTSALQHLRDFLEQQLPEDVRVKVAREDARLRYRLSYRDSGNEHQTADRTLAAGLLGVAENPLGISLECQEQELREDKTYLVPVLIRIPIGELVLLPEEGRHQAQISVFSVVTDEAGRSSDVHERSYPIDIENEHLMTAVEQDAEFTIGMVLREGEHRIAVSIRDDRSSSESTAFVDVMVGNGSEFATE